MSAAIASSIAGASVTRNGPISSGSSVDDLGQHGVVAAEGHDGGEQVDDHRRPLEAEQRVGQGPEEPVELPGHEQPHHAVDVADLAVDGGAVDLELPGDVLHRRALDAVAGEAGGGGVEERVERGRRSRQPRRQTRQLLEHPAGGHPASMPQCNRSVVLLHPRPAGSIPRPLGRAPGMPTLQRERELELPPYAADLDEVPPIVLRHARHFGRGDEARSRRALIEMVVGACAAAVVCIALTGLLLGNGVLGIAGQLLLPPIAAVLGAVLGFLHWYRSATNPLER